MKIENINKFNDLNDIRNELKLVTDASSIYQINVNVYCNGQHTASLPENLYEKIKDLCKEELDKIEKEIIELD